MGFGIGVGLSTSFLAAQSNSSIPVSPSSQVPPVHLIPVTRSVTNPQYTRSETGTPGVSPFQGLEQDLALPQIPVERISQTPAKPETRPVTNYPNSLPQQSVLNGNGLDLPSGQVPSSIYQDAAPRQPARLPAANDLRVPAHSSSSNPQSLAPEGLWQDETGLSDDDKTNPQRKKAEKDCGLFRTELLSTPISTIALDISPPRHTRGDAPEQIFRNWTDIFGNNICSGRMINLNRGYVVIDTGTGIQKISFSRLGESDLAAICEAWQLPSHCLVSTSVFQGRCWMPQTMTWHAANLCHKPLYFEDRQLERYGHSDGPFMQPVRSTAHFFVSLVTLPYQTGIHPPNECQYALGYYRPGNCAPWLAYPVPISGNGALHQAGFMIPGAFTIF